MRCVACELENPQVRELCFRCSHPLDFSKLIVEPPRQTKFGRLLWKALPLSRLRFYQGVGTRLARSRYLMKALSIMPGLGHLCLARYRFAAGLFCIWIVTSRLETGGLTLRPGMWVMMVQCFAMSDAFIKATEIHMHWSRQLLVNIATAAFLAVSEMYFIGGILS